MMDRNIDNHSNTAQRDMLRHFKEDISNIRLNGLKLGLSDKEITNLFTQTYMELRNNIKKQSESTKDKYKAQNICQIFVNIFILSSLGIIFIYIIMNAHYPTSSLVIRNVQGFTYPTSKVVRFLSIPIIKLFSSLSNLYDESCLVENPYFYVSEMDCWPCEKLNTVSNLTDSTVRNFIFGSPFIVKLNDISITLKRLRTFFTENKAIFDKEKTRMNLINSYNSIDDIFDSREDMKLSSFSHFSWRFKRMSAAQTLRQIFPKPHFLLDRMGESTERFIFIDGTESLSYLLPNTECSYVLVIQSSGERTIVLKPSNECSNRCGAVSVLLEESYVLWYNWWYWRPLSVPSKNSTVPSITYINSYC